MTGARVSRLVVAGALLTATYVLAVDGFTGWDFGLGAVLATALLLAWHDFVLPAEEKPGLGGRLVAFLPFALAVAGNVVSGTWNVARIVVGLGKRFRPVVLVLRLPEATRTGLAVFAFAQTLSPGSVVLELREQERELTLHMLGVDPPDRLRATLEQFYRRWQRPVFP